MRGINGIPLKVFRQSFALSIQMYEQRNKDVNKAQAITLAKIARVLGCDIEDLLESEPIATNN